MPVTNWWDAPEYGKAKAMTFPAPKEKARMRRVGTDVRYDDAAKKWVSTPIRVYVAASHV